MKSKLFILAITTLFLSSCSSDDSNGNSGSSSNYFPLTDGNYWTYDVEGENLSNRDSIYISNDTVINTVTYKKVKSLAIPFGFYSSSLNNNGLRKEGDAVLMTGAAGLNLGETLPINLAVTNLIIFKESATVNEQLSSVSGTLSQDLQGFPLTINYVLKTVALESLPSFTSPDNTVYTDVKKVKIVVNLKVSTVFSGIPIPINLLNSQDVVVSTQYYAKNIGMVYNNTVISYELEDFSALGVELPIPQSDTQTQEEFLDTYQAN